MGMLIDGVWQEQEPEADKADPAALLDPRAVRTAAAEHAIDRLREKFGRAAVIKGLAFGATEADES